MRGTHLKVAWLIVAGLIGTALVAQAPANATAKCKDNTYSTATSARGMCSGHGGVAAKLAAKPKAVSASAGATLKCADGTTSSAKTTRGACSKHGGLASASGAAVPVHPAAASPPASPDNASTVSRPSGSPVTATAKCRDGTYSESQQHSGACSHHGGVAEWYR